MGNRSHLVSIGMPVFNDKQFISKAIDSLLNQTVQDFELIISDDGSTDGSAEICRGYADKDSRIIYIRQEHNLGISRNMEFLLTQAKGTYFMWAANDDLWHPQFLEKTIDALQLKKKAIVAFGKYIFINEADTPIIKHYPRTRDFSSKFSMIRLLKLVWYFDDGFGYGLFRRKFIEDVRFPVWWGVNKNTAYNNIYPTLFYYLSRGDFAFIDSNEPIWFNRLKESKNINHVVAKQNSYIKKTFAFALRKINLLAMCVVSMYYNVFSIFNIIVVSVCFIFRIVLEFLKELLINTKHLLEGKLRLYSF